MAVKYCPQCGEAVGAEDRFCPECGTALRGETEAPRREPASAPSKLPIAIGVLAAIGVLLILAGFLLDGDGTEGVVELPAVPETAQPENELPFPDIPRLALDEAAALGTADEVVFVDVRERTDYAEAHIPDALSVPLGETALDPAYQELPEDATIVTYCT